MKKWTLKHWKSASRIPLARLSPSSSPFNSRVFSIERLKKELGTASNIKDRVNRQCVERALTMIIKRFPAQNEKGLFIFAGIEKSGEEIFAVIEPVSTSSLSYYRCDNKFHTFMITDAIKDDNLKMWFVYLTGDEYSISSFSNKVIKTIQKGNTLLIKRQRKGGQSSVRFARLAEESRHHCVSYMEEQIHELLLTENRPVLIDGSQELVDMLMERLKGEKTLIVSTNSNGKLINDKKELENWLIKLTNTTEKQVEKILSEIKRDPDLFVFGSELSEFALDRVFVLRDKLSLVKDAKIDNQKLVIIERNSAFYLDVLRFGGLIGKLHYKVRGA